ncbi:MAG: HNH endonuclease [Cytophagales bacterium]|nr:MAG: HNH endonuclease [Cytophagales bacterium]
MTQQNYEEYWSLTLAFTDFNGTKFLNILQSCVNFIDKYKNESYSDEKYARLQNEIQIFAKIDLISVRKAINQLVKMGFIQSLLTDYSNDTSLYLKAKSNRKRSSLFSKIIYSKSSFNSSISKESNIQQINFLIKTLVENGKLTKSQIIALMLVDIEKIKKGYLNQTELTEYESIAQKNGFITRKYNQVGYLFNILNKLDDIVFINDELYFTEDAKQIFGENLELTQKKRDPYLHLLYKNQLKDESFEFYKSEKCMVENLAFPVLIASHIKPFIKSNDHEAYDPDNGFLLSRNIDSLFDLGYITFDNFGKIITAKKLSSDVVKSLKSYSLEISFLNEKRKKYLDFHRNEVFEKRYSLSV